MQAIRYSVVMEMLRGDYQCQMAVLLARRAPIGCKLMMVEGLLSTIKDHNRKLKLIQSAINDCKSLLQEPTEDQLWSDIDDLQRRIIECRESKIELNDRLQEIEEDIFEQEKVKESKQRILHQRERNIDIHERLLSKGLLSGSTLSSATPRHQREHIISLRNM